MSTEKDPPAGTFTQMKANLQSRPFSIKVRGTFDGKGGMVLQTGSELAGGDATAEQRLRAITGLQATCESCGLIYPIPTALGAGAGVFGIELEGEIPGTPRCPRCGAHGLVSELIGIVEDAIFKMVGPEASLDQLSRIVEVLTAAIARNETDPSVVAAAVAREAPDQSALIEVLNRIAEPDKVAERANRRTLLVCILTLLLGVIQTILSRFPPHSGESPAPASREEIKALLDQALKTLEARQGTSPSSPLSPAPAPAVASTPDAGVDSRLQRWKMTKEKTRKKNKQQRDDRRKSRQRKK